MVRFGVLVAAVAALVGCGTLSNSAKSPSFHGSAHAAAVLTVECDRGAPASGVASVSGDKMKASLKAHHLDAASPADAALICSTYGRGMGGVEGFDVPANVASIVRDTAKASNADSVLVDVVAYDRGCSDSDAHCSEKSIDGATVRALLFSADGAIMWKKWDFAPEADGEAERAFAVMFADVPADKLVTAAATPAVKTEAAPTTMVAAAVSSPEPVAAAPAPAPETAATLISEVRADASSTCAGYAKLVCDKTSLDACREAVSFVNERQPTAAKCKALSKRVKSRKVAAR